jgi:hypothetical protein
MALGYSLVGWIKSSRTLSKYVKPIANWYADLAGYRQMGLKYDDLCVSCLAVVLSTAELTQYSGGREPNGPTGDNHFSMEHTSNALNRTPYRL